MKKNIFKKLGGAFLGLALGLGVVAGVASAPKASEVKADNLSQTFTFTNNSGGTSETTTSIGSWSLSGGQASLDSNGRGVQWTGSKSDAATFTFASTFTGTVTSMTINASANKSDKTVTYEGVSKSILVDNENNTGYTWDNLSLTKKDSIVLGITIPSVSKPGSCYISKITLNYTGGGGGETTNYTVTFDANGHGTAPQAATVASGEKVSRPTDPSASGYTFGGWYKEAGCTTAYDFNTAVTSSFTLYAKWTENGGGGGDTPSGEYTLVTSASSLKSNDKVIVALAGTSGPATGVKGMNTNNKDATVSGTQSEWVEYTVTISGTGFTLNSGDSYINFVEKAIKYGDASVLNVTTDGYLCLNSTPTMILFNQQTFYRPYTGKLGTSGYTPFSVYKVGSAAKLVSISTLSATVSARTGDTSWTIADVSVTGVLDDSASVVDISKVVEISVVQSVPEIEQDGTMSVTLKATGKTETTVTKSVSVTAQLKYINPYAIENIYSASKGDVVTIDGIYMGQVRDAAIIMSGEYGADLYYGTDKTTKASLVPAEFNSYVPGETKLTVTGTIDIYNNLVEVKPSSFSVLTDNARIAKIETPEVYIINGTETGNDMHLAARKTHATGVVTSITDASGNKNINLNVNGNTVAIFVASGYATTEVMNAINASKDNSTDITIEGFTSFYKYSGSDPFMQIQFTGIVEKKADYLAANFAADLLELTDDVCASYDGVANNKDALGNVWLTLQDADHWLGLAGTEQEILAAASASETGTDVEKAMARYDYLVAKYGLTNFIERTVSASARTINFVNSNNNTSTIIIVIVSVVSLTTLGALIMIKRRKTTDK